MQNCCGLDNQVMVTSGMQSNELHKGCAARSPQSFWALSEGCAAEAFTMNANKAGCTIDSVYVYCHLPS